jgi:hypothetical protein
LPCGLGAQSAPRQPRQWLHLWAPIRDRRAWDIIGKIAAETNWNRGIVAPGDAVEAEGGRLERACQCGKGNHRWNPY